MKKQLQQQKLNRMLIAPVASESNSDTANDENKPNNATDSKPAESTSEKETTESTTSTGNQEKPAQ